MYVFLAEKYISVIHNHTRHTHNFVLVLERFEMADIVYMSCNIWIFRRYPLCGHNQVRAHGTRQRDQDLHICFARNSCDLMPD